MPYKISWYIEERVILIQINGKIAIDEFEQLHTESFDYVMQSQFKVHAIADLSQFEAIPTNLRMLSSATSKENNSNQGMTVLVMPKMPSIVRFIVSVVMQTLRLEYRVCETVDEAINILQRVDTELAPMGVK
jgi:hypothetical protein